MNSRLPHPIRLTCLSALGLLASVALHAFALLWIMPPKINDSAAVEPVPVSALRIRVVTRTPDIKSVPKAPKARARSARLKSRPDNVAASGTPTSGENKSYAQLLPKAGIDFPIADSIDASKAHTKHPGLQGFDPENDAISIDKKFRNLSKLTTFAKDLSERISVPPALKKVVPNGTARARLSRKGTTWQVSKVDGDQYIRALLYETLAALSPEVYDLGLLSASEFDAVRIHLEFRTVSGLDQTAKPLELGISGNKISIVMTWNVTDPKWQMLTTDPKGRLAVDILGVAAVLARPYIEQDSRADIDVKKLRLSPAFIRPL